MLLVFYDQPSGTNMRLFCQYERLLPFDRKLPIFFSFSTLCLGTIEMLSLADIPLTSPRLTSAVPSYTARYRTVISDSEGADILMRKTI